MDAKINPKSMPKLSTINAKTGTEKDEENKDKPYFL